MTIDLGFAPLDLGEGLRAGIVDVPGHERFLHNMLAGASGMDAVLLVVAANEGVMAQTREHLAILRHLDVRAVLVVMTKCDLLGGGERAARREAIGEQLAGTIAESAATFEASSRTGEGVDALRDALRAALRAMPRRNVAAPAYLPVDRAFSLPGIGTVVTGTLAQGTIERGDTLIVVPTGRRVRIRRIEVFGEATERAEAGARVALNLPGLDRPAVARGAAIADAVLVPRDAARVRFFPEDQARAALRRRQPVRVHLGSAEILGSLVFERLPESGGEFEATLHLRRAAVLFPGMRAVVRRLSPKTLLGGAIVTGTIEPHSADDGASAPDDAAILAALTAHALDGASAAALAAEVNLREASAQAALRRLLARGEVVALERPSGFVATGVLRTLETRVLDVLRALHAREPWSLGLTSLALARSLQLPEAILARAASALVVAETLSYSDGYYAARDHVAHLTPEQRDLLERLLRDDPAQPLRPRPYAEVVAAIERSGVGGATRALQTAIVRGELIRVGTELYRAAQMAAIRARIERHLARHQRMTAAQFRDIVGTSRKYAIPLLEWLDRTGVTLRDGDDRVLRSRAGSSREEGGERTSV